MGATEDNDVEKLAARLEREADDLERRSQDVGDHIEAARQEWQRERSDSGAVPEDSDGDAEPPADTSEASGGE